MPDSRCQARVVTLGSVARFGATDSIPRDVRPLAALTPKALAEAAGIERGDARALIRRARDESVDPASLRSTVGATAASRVLGTALLPDDVRLVINDVLPVGGRVMSDQTFVLRVLFATAEPVGGVVRVAVAWAGEPYVVEAKFGPEQVGEGTVDVPFAEQQTLPVGPAAFDVSMISDSGARGAFRVTCAVLPSNPFALRLSPRDHFVTGSFSLRSVRDNANYVTAMSVTLSNGDGSPVTVDPGFHWEFWDGPIGSGTLVERGDSSFAGGVITVAGHSVWGGWIVFTSPPGSGVFGKLNAKEDLAFKLTMRRRDGGSVNHDITVRTMFRFGLNITRVGAESFTTAEYADLYAAVDVTRAIYERRDVTLSVDRRNITNSQAGGFTVITSEDEARDLFAAWSGPDNQFIDVFVVPAITGTSFDGLAGGIPGPTSHDGRSSGVVINKSGYVDGTGTRHLNVNYLGMLIGHEVGHYLGLAHVNDAGNLMLPNSSASDTALNYNPQYRTIIRFDWVRID